MLDIAYDIEELIERISHETVNENLNKAVMENSDVNLGGARACLERYWPNNNAEIGHKS